MLSQRFEIEDCKSLIATFDFYGFASEEEMDSLLRRLCGMVTRERMLEIMSEEEYRRLAAKDKSKFTHTEELIYNAEVYFVIAEFMRFLGNEEKAKITPSNGPAGSNSTTIGKEDVFNLFVNIGYRLLHDAGFNTTNEIAVL
jgi:hypothetical protein